MTQIVNNNKSALFQAICDPPELGSSSVLLQYDGVDVMEFLIVRYFFLEGAQELDGQQEIVVIINLQKGQVRLSACVT